MPTRCNWPGLEGNALYEAYHDTEWGVPVHDDKTLFAFLILEGAQAGLSWSTILRKRESYIQAFDGFDPAVVATYGEEKTTELLHNDGIVRNRLKIASAIRNAKVFLAIQKEFGSFDAYLWQCTDGIPVQNHPKTMDDIPATSALSDTISKDLKQRGMNFVGSTIIYAYLQAIGMVNDHLTSCFRYKEVG